MQHAQRTEEETEKEEKRERKERWNREESREMVVVAEKCRQRQNEEKKGVSSQEMKIGRRASLSRHAGEKCSRIYVAWWRELQ